MTKATKIIPPEGYEVDKKKSTFEEIVFKKKSKLPESWEDLKFISGWYTSTLSEIKEEETIMVEHRNKNIFSSKELAVASLALAQLSQLRKVARDGWEPDWKDTTSLKYVITWFKNNITIETRYGLSCFLSFQSMEITSEFLEKYRDLIEQARPILGG